MMDLWLLIPLIALIFLMILHLAPNNNLPQARWATSAISGGKSINAKGFKKHRTDIDSNPSGQICIWLWCWWAICSTKCLQNIDRMEYATETIDSTLPVRINQLPHARSECSCWTLKSSNYGYFGRRFFSLRLMLLK